MSVSPSNTVVSRSPEASKEDREYLEELQKQIDEARRNHDEAQEQLLMEEFHARVDSLQKHDRQRDRAAYHRVKRAIDTARHRISQDARDLAQHLSAVHTGQACVYEPDAHRPWCVNR